MEITNSIPRRERVAVTIDDIQRNDVIYLSQKDDAVPYSVLDTGKPFVLIENLRTHFCNLYRPINIYKDL